MTSATRKNRLSFVQPHIKRLAYFMFTRLIRFVVPSLFAFTAVVANPQPATKPSPTPTSAPAKTGRTVVNQTAQVIILGYHGIVNKVQHPDTQITPQEFEKQMQELKDRGITVISLQDFLAWKRGEKNIPPRSAVLTFDDGLKSQYEVALADFEKIRLSLHDVYLHGGHPGWTFWRRARR